MSKDYANKNKYRPRRNDRCDTKFIPLAAAIFAVICFLSAMIFIIHAYHQSTFFSREHIASWFSHAKTMVAKKNKTSTNVSETQKTAENNDIRFDFYTELPNMQVNLPESAQMPEQKIEQSIKTVMAPKKINTVSAKKQTIQFIVQVGEFKNQLDASQMRLSLLLAGIETEIIKTPEHRYRVQQGPYPSARQAKLAQKQLSRKGFEGSVKEI